MKNLGVSDSRTFFFCRTVYQENQDEESWTVVASTRDELAKLIEELKGHRPIRPLSKDLIDEDSSSNSCSKPSEKEEKVKIEQKPSEQEYSLDNASHEFPLKQTIRLIKKSEAEPEAMKEEEPAEPEEQVDEKELEIQERAIQKKRRRK